MARGLLDWPTVTVVSSASSSFLPHSSSLLSNISHHNITTINPIKHIEPVQLQVRIRIAVLNLTRELELSREWQHSQLSLVTPSSRLTIHAPLPP